MNLFITTAAAVTAISGCAALFQAPAPKVPAPVPQHEMAAPKIPEGKPEATLSPFFWVKSEDPSVDQLPLKSTSVKTDIAGVIADVRVTQVYRNEGRNPIEAVYIFPASTRAAVYGMKMTIGERTLVAKIREKEQARRDYEQARAEGRSASLLEQKRPNVFQMNVANIMPGDEIRVELSYTELLLPTNGTYEFVYPTVVGPRYSNTPSSRADASEKWVANPYTNEGEAPLSAFAIQVRLAAGLPIQHITCGTHKTGVTYDGPSDASVKLDTSETHGGNRDFILKYQLTGDQIQSGLLLAKGAEENFFLLQVQPPKAVKPAMIPPREFIFIMDVSGSQMGFPIEISKTLMEDLVSHLRPQDRFNVEVFESGSALWSPEGSRPANRENIQDALAFIGQQRGGGGTEIISALRRALALPRAEGMSRTFVISTDGYVSVEPGVLDVIRENLGGANMFAFGVGSSVNRHLIEGMAHAGMGEPFVLTNPAEAPAQAERFRNYIASPVLTNVKLTFNGNFQAYDVEPLQVPDLLAERPVICFGKWKGGTTGSVEVTGISGNGPFRQSFEISKAKVMDQEAALRNLWARHRIQLMGDYAGLGDAEGLKKSITELGLKYGLLTNYTSFVAVDSQIRNHSGQAQLITQPLPLPQGVSNMAVGGRLAKSMACAPAPRLKMDLECRREEPSDRKPIVPDTADPMLGIRQAELAQRLKEPTVAKLLADTPAGTFLELRIDARGNILSARFTKPFRGAREACETILKWRFQNWTGQGITRLRIPV